MIALKEYYTAEDDKEQERWLADWREKHKNLKYDPPLEIMFCMIANLFGMVMSVFVSHRGDVTCGRILFAISLVCAALEFCNYFLREHWRVD
jgi:hypothetical protein